MKSAPEKNTWATDTWRGSTPCEFRHMDAQPIGELLAEMTRDGPLRPEQIVEEARNPASPLHDCFVWDLERAAFRHHLDHAHDLICSIERESGVAFFWVETGRTE